MKINPTDFFDKYKLIGSIDLYKPQHPLRCRFCGEESADFFKNDSHLIPELLGENNFIAKDECDKCNTYFSKYESQLAIMARPFLTLTNTKTKRKTPIFQSRSDFENQVRTIIKVDKDTTTRNIRANYEDISIDKENGIHEIILRSQGFKPIDVYRVLSKIVLGLMPHDLIKENTDFFDWVLEKKELYEIPHSFRTMLLTKYFEVPSAVLYQAKELIINQEEYPEFIGIVCFANVVIQFYLPISDKLLKNHSNENGMKLCIFPAFAYDGALEQNQKLTIIEMDLTEREICKPDEKFTFTERK